MNDRKSLIFAIVTETAKYWKYSLVFALLVQVISNLQTTFLILQQLSTISNGYPWICLTFIQQICTRTAIVSQPDLLGSSTVVRAIWLVCIVYFVFHIGLLLIILFFYTKEKRYSLKFPFLMSKLYLIHSRVVFFPIHYFFAWYIAVYSQSIHEKNNTVSDLGAFGVISSILLCLLNIGLALLREFFSFQIRKSKDPFATKNNLFAQIALCHKIIHTLFFFFITSSSMKGPILIIINLATSLVYCWDLMARLSFYNILMLKVNTGFALAHFMLSLLFGINYLGYFQKYSEVILIVAIPLVIKLSLKSLYTSFARIFTLDFRTPEEAAHVPTLLQVYMNCNDSVIRCKNQIQGAFLARHGLLKLYANEVKQIQNENTVLGDNQMVYMTFLKKCHVLLRRYPKSELLMIIMAQVYINKIGNSAWGLSLLNQLKASRVSIPAQNSVESIFNKLKGIYSKCYAECEEKLAVMKYFEKRDFGNKLKDNIQKEVMEQLRFWKEISLEKVDIKTVIEIAYRIDAIAQNIERIWVTTFKDNKDTFASLVLMYGIYLEMIRGNHYERIAMMQRYHHLMKNKDASTKVTPFDESVVVLLVSIEHERLGRVVDASTSVKNIFKIEKERLIGRKLYNLMPKVVAKEHDSFLEKYSRVDARNMYREITTYAKTMDGNFFEIELEVRICPSLAKGLNLVAQVKQVRGEELVIIADQKGTVVDCADGLLKTLKINNKDIDLITVMDLCPDFKAIHHSFNICYYGENEVLLDPDETSQIVESTILKQITEGSSKSHKKLHSQTSLAVKFLSKMHTLAGVEGSDEYDKKAIPSTPFLITKDIAEDFCHKFKNGIKLNFYPLRRDRTSAKTREKIEFIVRVEPYVINGNYYKMIRLKNFFVEQKILNLFKGETLATITNVPPQNNNILTKRKSINIFRKAKDAIRKTRMERNNFDITKKLFNLNLWDNSRTDKNLEESGLIKHDSTQISYKRRVTDGENPAQPSSTFSRASTHSTSFQAIKTLNNLFQKKELRSVTKFSVFSVYFSTLVVLVLTTIDYFFSKESIADIQDGVEIVNIANNRLIDTIVAWQWLLIIYTRSVGVRVIVPSFIKNSRDLIADRDYKMLQKNNELKNRLELLDRKDFANIFFVQDIAFWQPSTGDLFASDYIDSFTATKVLSTKYLKVALFEKSVLLLEGNEEVLFAINNTANGLLLRSEEELNQSEVLLRSIVSNNESLLTGFLVLKIISLALVLLSLLLLVRVILSSYSRLFRAIAKIKEYDILRRGSDLELILACMNEAIESKNLIDELEMCLDAIESHSRKQPSKDKRAKVIFREDKFSLRALIIQTSKYLTVALVLLSVLTIVFSISFFQYMEGFDKMQLINSRISLAHKLGYEFDMLLPTFYFFIVFQNYPTFLIRNQDPELQFNASVETLKQANHILLQSLSDPGQGLDDPVLEDFFQHNLCNYVKDSSVSSCEKSTKGKVLGFSELNAQYVETHVAWASEYRKNRTYSNARVVLVPYAAEIVNDVTVIEDAYHFLANRLLMAFNTTVDDLNSEILSLFAGVLISLLVSTVIIQLITIKQFRKDDLATKKILRVIPLHIIQDTKILGAFLVGEYKEEVEGIKRFLLGN